MIGIYYTIRHKATGEFMPQLKGKGYTHWNPDSEVKLDPKKFTGCPRLFPSMKMAKRVIAVWNSLPNGYTSFISAGNFSTSNKSVNDCKPDGRKKEDLEVVIVNIEETGVIT